MQQPFVIPFREISKDDVQLVGGKNASLGEMINHLNKSGVKIPNGFATTVSAYELFIHENHFKDKLIQLLSHVEVENMGSLATCSSRAKHLIRSGEIPEPVSKEILSFYREFCKEEGRTISVAVRSSATSEDMPGASFAGLHESFLNITGEIEILQAVKQCFASLFNARAIKYRADNGYDHDSVAISVGIQKMIRSDISVSGTCFTIDPDSGFSNVIVIHSSWGLCENIVQGVVMPDEFTVFKPLLGKVKRSIISSKLGSKKKTMVFKKGTSGTKNTFTSLPNQQKYSLLHDDILNIAKMADRIEKHYGNAMDIEWAKDGLTNDIYIVQARPETVFSNKNLCVRKEFKLVSRGKEILRGNAVGNGIISGLARVILHSNEASKLLQGEILVTESTNPDWDPILKKARAVITDKGGRTSHAAIVARETGALALVGTEVASKKIQDGQLITLDDTKGQIGMVYDGAAEWTEKKVNMEGLTLPKTDAKLILADPEQAFNFSFYPNSGVGLLRLEFIISHSIGIHPMALVEFDNLNNVTARKKIEKITHGFIDKSDFFIEKLSESIAKIASAFYPKEVIVRMSDFKSNEYAGLLGGKQFELEEENPMLGFRGAARYYNSRYKKGFRLECLAIKKAREDMGFKNIKIMIPFCRTIQEAKKVIALAETFGLTRGEKNLEIYMMAEIPNNIIQAEQFAKYFDGFSIGSNDLTQLILGVDRDSNLVSTLFNENDEGVKKMISELIKSCKKTATKVGFCGQIPSDDPEFAAFLVNEGIDSISFNPDAVIRGIENMKKAEEKKGDNSLN